MLRWMAWSPPVAVFFTCIGLMLVVMTVWELRAPSVRRRGWLPIATTRGDRLFIGLLTMGFASLAYIAARPRLQALFALAAEPSMWFGLAIALVLLVVVMRKG